MVKGVKSGYSISEIYQGGYSSLNPPQNTFAATGDFGLTTDPRTANILKEVSDKLSTGVKNIEIEALSPETFDAIPKQQLKEVNRLTKLTGIDVSVHGPVINVAGLGQSGYSEAERELSEKKIAETLLRSHDLNPEGNINVNFHSSEGVPGSQMLPPSQRKESDYKKLIVVNRETGQLRPLEPEIYYYPSAKGLKPEIQKKFDRGEITKEQLKKEDQIEIPLEKGELKTPERRVRILNESEWDNTTSQLFFNKERADEILEKNQKLIHHFINDFKEGKVDPENLAPVYQDGLRKYKAAEAYLDDIHKQVNNIFHKAYEFGDDGQRKKLKIISDEFKKDLEKDKTPFGQSKAFDALLHELKSDEVIPKMYQSVEEFSIDKGSQSFGNAAFESYKKFKNTAPTLVIENPPAGQAVATGEDIRNIVKKSREQFVSRAVKEGVSEKEAKKQAEKLIGATWDVGHVNMLRKYGYSEEDIVKETEKVAPFLKHVHLSDNFGFEHTELPMGMGNVPLKEMMAKLGQKGFEAKKIIEAGHWYTHFRSIPFQESLELTGSPIYSMKNAPYWNQSPGLYQGYFGGMEGDWLPKVNYETFGTNFSKLPKELGGQFPGAQGSRMSGRPME